LGAVTIGYVATFAACSVWYGLSPPNPTADLLFMAACAVGTLLVLGNIVFALSARRYRLRHLALAAALLGVWQFSWWTAGWRVDRRRQWFAREGKAGYEQAVTSVLSNRQLLTSNERALEEIVSGHPHASAWTNPDGSITIVFPVLEGNYRHGYLYQAGGQLPRNIAKDPDTLHLTNGWYEY